jgi:predicted nucleotidyltransferase
LTLRLDRIYIRVIAKCCAALLLLLSWGPMQVVAEEFAELAQVERVVIFGSWAARYLGRTGHPPHDLDVLVVGQPNRASVYDAADRAQQRLGMPVNPVIRSAETWRRADDPLVRQIHSSPFVPVLELDDPAIEKARTADE